MERKKDISKFIPVGFRTKKIWKMVLALLGYGYLFFSTFILSAFVEEQRLLSDYISAAIRYLYYLFVIGCMGDHILVRVPLSTFLAFIGLDRHKTWREEYEVYPLPHINKGLPKIMLGFAGGMLIGLIFFSCIIMIQSAFEVIFGGIF